MLPETEIERLVRQGQAAHRLLQDEDFTEVLNALSDYHLAAMVAAKVGPSGADVREHHHTMLGALRELHGEIAGRAHALDQFETAQQEDVE